MSACVETRRARELIPRDASTARWGARALQVARDISLWNTLLDDTTVARQPSVLFSW
jgi:hypothetical protein